LRSRISSFSELGGSFIETLVIENRLFSDPGTERRWPGVLDGQAKLAKTGDHMLIESLIVFGAVRLVYPDLTDAVEILKEARFVGRVVERLPVGATSWSSDGQAIGAARIDFPGYVDTCITETGRETREGRLHFVKGDHTVFEDGLLKVAQIEEARIAAGCGRQRSGHLNGGRIGQNGYQTDNGNQPEQTASQRNHPTTATETNNLMLETPPAAGLIHLRCQLVQD
jgi:hypothetical protein